MKKKALICWFLLILLVSGIYLYRCFNSEQIIYYTPQLIGALYKDDGGRRLEKVALEPFTWDFFYLENKDWFPFSRLQKHQVPYTAEGEQTKLFPKQWYSEHFLWSEGTFYIKDGERQVQDIELEDISKTKRWLINRKGEKIRFCFLWVHKSPFEQEKFIPLKVFSGGHCIVVSEWEYLDYSFPKEIEKTKYFDRIRTVRIASMDESLITIRRKNK